MPGALEHSLHSICIGALFNLQHACSRACRDLEGYEAAAKELEGRAEASAPAEGGQQEGDAGGVAGGQEEEGAGEGAAEQAPQEEQMEAAAAPEGKQEAVEPPEPGAQERAAPRQGLKAGVVAGDSEEAPPVVTPRPAGGGPSGGHEGPAEQARQVQRMAEVAAPEAQLVPKEVAPAAAAAASAAQVAAGQKRKAEGEPGPAGPAEQQEQAQQEAAEAGSHEEGGPRARKRSKKKAAEPGSRGHGVYLAAVQAIPAGETATYSEVSRPWDGSARAAQA